MIVIILLIILLIICLMGLIRKHDQLESFSEVNDDIGYGNPVSMSGKPNPYPYINQVGYRNPVIYQGFGIPLIHEDHPTTPNDPSMFYFSNYRCRPECCLYSSDSCTNGCVCRGVQPQTYLFQNEHLTPRS